MPGDELLEGESEIELTEEQVREIEAEFEQVYR